MKSPPEITFLSLALGALLVGCGQNKFEKELEKEISAVTLAREAERGGYDLITTAELEKLLEEKTDMLLLDAMPADAFQKEHIPGAKQFLLPISEMNDWDPKQTDGKTKDDFVEFLGPDKGRLIVVYCGFVKCTRSHNGAMWAVREGYTNVRRLPGGIFAWKGARYPTESGK